MKFIAPLALAFAMLAAPALADHHAAGEVIVTNQMEFPADAEWKHSFDAGPSEAGKPNGSFARALAYIRAMEAEGVDPARVKVAIVVHGPAVFDVVNDARYGEKYKDADGAPMRNQNYNNVADLVARGAEIWVCGVAAKYHGVGNAHLLEGVKMAPSATAAHADLQRRGFGINPF
ncbi:MAG TPA: DsrE family protein, partial [Erythrobacter sp.]|nr:DsrE family protein [Erythrobacter sp.]